jgi:hypothetical protein
MCRIGVPLLVVTGLLSGGLGLTMGRADTARLRAFSDAVRRWQGDPDFRQVQQEYVTLGADAMRARLCGISAEHYVMAFRSLPGLPDSLAVSETSAAHYRAFSAGPLSAYLHLADEQGVAAGVAMVEELGRRQTFTDADARSFLRGFKLPLATVMDDGAVASVRRLVRETMPTTQPFAVREVIVPAILRHVGRDVKSMARGEQVRVMSSLDEEIRHADMGLWRAKQVSDFLAGIWAQAYGQVYETAIGYLLFSQQIARFVFVAIVLLLTLVWIRHRARTPG